ncbi:hypothetical protein BGZ51_008854, partial [Haplosporangium sp. Z 767]
SFKIAAALVLAAFSAQAIPLTPAPSCLGDLCNQSVDSGNVNIGSTTSIVPITEVTPITRYQPYVETYAPIVNSECGYGGYGGLGGYGYGYGGYGDINDRMRGVYGSRFGPRLYGSRFMKRDLEEDKEESEEHKGSSGSLLFSQFQSSECAADDASCVSSIPPQTVDMGSQVMIQPTNEILPTTTYQGKIESLESSIEAAPGMSSSLPQHNVNLGSNVAIQPVTKVYPDTTYQPTVNQLSTSIYAAEQYDESLPQSSVLLGSNVHIQPHVSVVPLTTFQPSIKSKPFIINVEQPCF